MSVDAMVAAHDEAALAALASKGLLRRAARDLEAGRARVLSRDDGRAEVEADGLAVVLTEAGPGAATCPCPATGVCRHVLLAVLALRSEAPSAPAASAGDDLSALSDEDLRTFAGADWQPALRQAHGSGRVEPEAEGGTVRLRLPDATHAVAFLPGQGLAGAVFKGPPTTKRRVVTAAALVARAALGGAPIPAGGTTAAAAALSTETLDEARAAISALVAALPEGGAVLAEARLFDLSVSARAEAAPRLTGLLRALSRGARALRDRSVGHSDLALLVMTAEAAALTRALARTPADPALTGVVARRFAETPPRRLLVLGTAIWAAGSGARGLRVILHDPEAGTWHEAGQARAPGADPGFSPEGLHRAALWGLAPPAELAGRGLRLAGGRIAADGALAWEGGTAGWAEGPDVASLAHLDWAEARADLAARAGRGLRRSARPVPVVLRPSGVGPGSFDDIAQVHRLPVLDRRGARLDLTLPADRPDAAAWLGAALRHRPALLCEAGWRGTEAVFAPVTVHGPDGATDVTAGRLPAVPMQRRAAPLRAPTLGPVAQAAEAALEALTEALLRRDGTPLAEARRGAAALGLDRLDALLERAAGIVAPDDVLAAAYLAAELVRDG